MKNRLFSLLLCLVLCCGLLPIMGGAEENNPTVIVSDLDHPVIGRELDTTYNLTTSGGLYYAYRQKTTVIWFDQGYSMSILDENAHYGNLYSVKGGGKVLSPGAIAERGHYYLALLALSGPNGTSPLEFENVGISEDMARRVKRREVFWDASAAIPSKNPVIALYYKADGNGSLIGFEVNREFNGALVAGDTASWSASDIQTGNSYDLSSIEWKDGNRTMGNNDVFQAGKTYTLLLTIDSSNANCNETFTTTPSTALVQMSWFTVISTGISTGICEATDFNVIDDYRATATFSFPCKSAVKELSIGGIKIPEIGSAIQTSGFTTNSNGVVVTDAEWLVVGNTGDTSGAFFSPNTTYLLKLTLAPEDGYILENPQKITSNAGTVKEYSYRSEGQGLVYVTIAGLCPGPPEKIRVTTPPAKTEYGIGDNFDPAGMVVTAYYNDETSTPVTNYTVFPSSQLTLNDTRLTISYTEGNVTRTTSLDIEVNPFFKHVKSIAITTPPSKTTYRPGESFNPSGMVVTATCQDGSTKPVTDYTITPEVLTENTKKVTITYNEGDKTWTATQDVTVVDANQPQLSVQDNPFTDVKASDLFCDAVLWAYYAEPQVTNGISATKFNPTGIVTRAQCVTFLWRAMGCPEPAISVNPFMDVSSHQYYYKAVLWAVEKGITMGTDATHFNPNGTLTTAHIATFLYRTLGIGTDGWYQDAAAWAKNENLLSGLNTTIAPNVDCPRSSVVLFLYRELGK